MVINPIVGVYIPIIRIPIKGGMTIPNTRSLDPGSNGRNAEKTSLVPWAAGLESMLDALADLQMKTFKEACQVRREGNDLQI